LKWIHYTQDTEGRNMELRYFRDIDMREVDFVVTENLKPLRFIEVKWSDAPVSKSLLYMMKKFPGTEGFQMIGALAEALLSAIVELWNSFS
jgi:hypothetical protein